MADFAKWSWMTLVDVYFKKMEKHKTDIYKWRKEYADRLHTVLEE